MDNIWIFYICGLVLIIFSLMTYICFGWIQDSQETKEAEIFFNGTMLGQAQTIAQIQSNIQTFGLDAKIPFFQEDGNVTSVFLGDVCNQLEVER